MFGEHFIILNTFFFKSEPFRFYLKGESWGAFIKTQFFVYILKTWVFRVQNLYSGNWIYEKKMQFRNFKYQNAILRWGDFEISSTKNFKVGWMAKMWEVFTSTHDHSLGWAQWIQYSNDISPSRDDKKKKTNVGYGLPQLTRVELKRHVYPAIFSRRFLWTEWHPFK